ncbi:MAG TPA: FKBP-type peptidyl-prolyl cis-trans isomerase [Candidatus Saccharimonadales bacterium]|nr:FKBP-type peptidyl-prolyl cis-trans isomerase [Candidatus Saccharimonadales bacterium]
MGPTLGNGTKVAGLLGTLGLALALSACGGSLDSGVTAPSPAPTPSVVAASPSPSASASASTCVNPDTTATYQLAGSRVLAGNLQVKDQVLGTGKQARTGDTVKIDYTGSLPDGTVFDKSANDNGGKPVSLTLAAGKVIEGFVEGLNDMRVGGTRELVIPAALGYGCQAVSSIPANSTLIFTVKLVSVS